MIDTRPGSPFQRVFYWFAWSLMSVPWSLMFRWKFGFADLPRDRPFLLLSNHTSLFDPLWSAFWIGRRATFMASAALFRVPVLRWLLPLCGCFPKAKYVKDRDSMAFLAERYRDGDVIMIFPEGKRSWDGRPGEVGAGIGRLVKRLDAEVVVSRVLNGHLYQPRWAPYPRWLPIRVEHELLELDTSASAEELTRQIADAMRIDHTIEAPPRSIGWRMAHGLPAFLWACPSCFELEGLEVDPRDGDSVVCSGCQQRWTLDTSNRMNGEHPMRVTEAIDRVRAYFKDPPRADHIAFEVDRSVLTSPQARLLHLVQGKPSTLVDRGAARLDDQALQVGETRFELGDVHAVSVEIANMLTFRVEGVLYRLEVPGESTLKWAHFLRGWTDLAPSPPSGAGE